MLGLNRPGGNRRGIADALPVVATVAFAFFEEIDDEASDFVIREGAFPAWHPLIGDSSFKGADEIIDAFSMFERAADERRTERGAFLICAVADPALRLVDAAHFIGKDPCVSTGIPFVFVSRSAERARMASQRNKRAEGQSGEEEVSRGGATRHS